MENASKALLIAGAILICILIIAVGMFIFNSANETINSAVGQMSQKDKELYNSAVSRYMGKNKRGTEVKEMITAVISSNDQHQGESGKFISIEIGTENGVTGYKDAATLNSACQAANLNYNPDADNNATNLKAAREAMRTLSSKISSGKTYNIDDEQQSGVIVKIIIDEVKD